MALEQHALDVLKATSRTFFIPISHLPDGLQEAIGVGYLCMRAIDEIEDHPALDNLIKARLLHNVSLCLQGQTLAENFERDPLDEIFKPYRHVLPEVTLRLGEWAPAAPEVIAPRIWEATAAMADRMAQWAAIGWKIVTEADLDRYTFGVAGAVGLLLCDVWAWFDGGQLQRAHAIQFGRGLQAVNILRNRREDLSRGVDLYPVDWTGEDVQHYARRNLQQSEAYARTLPPGPFAYLIKIPLALAYATLDSLARGEPKLSRGAVLQILAQLQAEGTPD
jgi:farnesyl-diphosphate farnesyltransferase